MDAILDTIVDTIGAEGLEDHGMAKDATKIVEVKEREWTDSIGSGLVGLTLMICSGLVIYFGRFWVSPHLEFTARVVATCGMVSGTCILGVAIYRALTVEQIPNVAFACPF